MSKNTDLGNLVNGLFVSSTRNVGVGTTTPANALVVDRGNATASYLQFTAGTTTGVLATDGFEVGIDASGNGIISQQENLPLMIYTNAAERMRITAGGNVGINGTPSSFSTNVYFDVIGNSTAQGGILQSRNSDNSIIGSFFTNANGLNIRTETSNAILLSTAGTERMRITSPGTVLINTTTTFTNEKLRVVGAVSANGLIRFENTVNQVDVNHGVLMICNTANYAVGNDASIGFSLNRADNTAQDPRASIGCKTSSNLGGDLVFNTRNDSNFAERMRITSGGNVGIGVTNPVYRFEVNGELLSRGIAAGYSYSDRNSASIYALYAINGFTYFYSGSSNIAQINMSNGAYAALSDINKKKDFEQSNVGLNEVLQLKPTLYRLKGTEELYPKELGFIAQEVKEFIPQAYSENGEFIGLIEMPLIAALTKAIQELKAEIDVLKNK
jgi:hypothetical protein